jgi:nitrogen regulatory protein P-II 1
VRGHGRQGGIELSWRGTSFQMDLLPKMQLNIILSDHNVEKAVETITKAARTGKEGDGIIFIYPVEEVIRIRTGERGREALMYPDDIDVRREH